jgi:hypothetical protein
MVKDASPCRRRRKLDGKARNALTPSQMQKSLPSTATRSGDEKGKIESATRRRAAEAEGREGCAESQAEALARPQKLGDHVRRIGGWRRPKRPRDAKKGEKFVDAEFTEVNDKK